MLDKPILLKRLSLIKYIFENGIREYKQPEPLSMSALLLFHDSVELFLGLAIEHLDIFLPGKKDLSFTEYWDKIKEERQIEVTQKGIMTRMNLARVAFKHHGTMISKLDLETFSSITYQFFIENCASLFAIDFSSISMVELVTEPEIREKLNEAIKLLDDMQFPESLDAINKAFFMMIAKYESNKMTRFYGSIFRIAASPSFFSSHDFHYDRNLEKLANYTIESIEEIQNTMKIVGYGIDFRKYSRFSYLTPIVYSKDQGETLFFEHRYDRTLPFTEEDTKYCLDFCIESYLILYSYDFEINRSVSEE